MIRPKLPQTTVITYINHGSMQKIADKRSYVQSTYMWDVSVVSGKKDLDLLYKHKMIGSRLEDYPNPILLNEEKRPLMIVHRSPSILAFAKSKRDSRSRSGTSNLPPLCAQK